MREALESIRKVDHPFSHAQGLRSAAAFHQCLRQPAVVQEHSQNGVALAREHGFGAVLLATRFHQGWLFLDQGREDEGLAAMRAWVDRSREIRAECLIPNYLGWLADAVGRLGQRREALDLLDEALAAASRTSIHYWTAELHRSRGALADSEEQAESSLREALAVARRQNAKSLELRAALDLGRLLASRGRARDAHALLAETYGWFTEGFATADLEDARALLDELASAAS
jgi:predicted ATPase